MDMMNTECLTIEERQLIVHFLLIDRLAIYSLLQMKQCGIPDLITDQERITFVKFDEMAETLEAKFTEAIVLGCNPLTFQSREDAIKLVDAVKAVKELNEEIFHIITELSKIIDSRNGESVWSSDNDTGN